LSLRQRGRVISHPTVTKPSEVLSVLTLTDRAADTIRALTSQPGVPADAGLRMSMQGSDEGRLALSLEGRQPDDAVIEDAGARVYVQHDATGVVEDRQLDAQLDEEGKTVDKDDAEDLKDDEGVVMVQSRAGQLVQGPAAPIAEEEQGDRVRLSVKGKKSKKKPSDNGEKLFD